MLEFRAPPLGGAPCVGASGAVAGMMGAYFIPYPRAWIDTIVFNSVLRAPLFCTLPPGS